MKSQLIYEAIGRRKCATAKVSLINGSGNILINNQVAEKYFQYNLTYLKTIEAPLKKLELENQYQMIVKVFGGGLNGQADAIKLAVSRVLCNLNIENRTALKSEGFLTSDSRVKERKKYGLKKARKASQYSKR
jgi:small subunit ribosomal protein S9|uniref:ribosomal protein S9 n=1 Tax=Gonyostomum semen TaxID=375454 RepID=UPI0010C4C343|nr:ribosomal protein S9 [Gonyostomum semen]QBS14292.1 large subunit ribosomal protein L13 [Gonyostomum semen]UTE94336.1 ribosomal protein S9 [Gonyostomum semen]